MKILQILLVLGSLLVFASCDRDADFCDNGTVGVFTDLTGLDGCGVVFERSSDGEYFEITNLEDFTVSVDGTTEYCVESVPVGDRISICMVGPFIEIISLTEQ